jgi:hypothetical protein
MSETDLTLEIMGKEQCFPPFSARECTQTLTPLSQGTLRRTINGTLVFLGNAGHQKFQSTISCKDKAPPAFSGLWKGSILKVGCIQSLTQTIPPKTLRIQLEREAVTLHVYDQSAKVWPVERLQDRWLSLPSAFPGGFVTYRPLLIMMVKKYHLETDEWGLTVGWSLELEEM